MDATSGPMATVSSSNGQHSVQNENLLTTQQPSADNDSPSYTCPVCDFEFAHEFDLKEHMLTHAADDAAKQHKCPECPTAFDDPGLLSLHMRGHSGGERPFTCSHCSAMFIRVEQLRSHMRLHNRSAPYGCTECTAAFHKESALTEHMHAKHSPDNMEVCAVCGQQILGRAMARHLR